MDVRSCNGDFTQVPDLDVMKLLVDFRRRAAA